jgi:hypothetical protein
MHYTNISPGFDIIKDYYHWCGLSGLTEGEIII